MPDADQDGTYTSSLVKRIKQSQVRGNEGRAYNTSASSTLVNPRIDVSLVTNPHPIVSKTSLPQVSNTVLQGLLLDIKSQHTLRLDRL
jgi:hypothetical protein